jgi:acetyltransferase-like isoleucine patch superfamily enzyme
VDRASGGVAIFVRLDPVDLPWSFDRLARFVYGTRWSRRPAPSPEIALPPRHELTDDARRASILRAIAFPIGDFAHRMDPTARKGIRGKSGLVGRLFWGVADFLRRLKMKRRAFLSRLARSGLAEAGGRIYFGSDCVIVGPRYIRCTGNFTAQDRNRIEAIDLHGGHRYAPTIIFGNNVSMENDCHIGAVNRIEIHDNVLMASRVYISDHSHGGTTPEDLRIAPNQRAIISKGPVVIEADVWLGEGVAVMPGVRIGRSSIIGANSVVTRDIPPFSVAAGAPARVIKSLGSDANAR